MSRLTPRIRILAAVVVASALSAGVTSVVTAGATTPGTTYYACLKAGKLTKVATAAPTCKAPATQISWNSQGPQGVQGPAGLADSTEYVWAGTIPANPSGPEGGFTTGSTTFPAGSTITLVSATATANLSGCPSGADMAFGFFVSGSGTTTMARWNNAANYVNAPPDTILESSASMAGSAPLTMLDDCFFPSAPFDSGVAVSFSITFYVTPPATSYH